MWYVKLQKLCLYLWLRMASPRWWKRLKTSKNVDKRQAVPLSCWREQLNGIRQFSGNVTLQINLSCCCCCIDLKSRSTYCSMVTKNTVLLCFLSSLNWNTFCHARLLRSLTYWTTFYAAPQIRPCLLRFSLQERGPLTCFSSHNRVH